MESTNQKPKGKGGKRPSNRSDWIKRGLGKHIATIDTSTLALGPNEVNSSAASEHVCSYNWATTANHSIYVPGAPPKWTSPTLPVTLPQDSGVYFIDQNGYKMPSCPFIPLFSALRATNPSFSFAGVDLLTNRNSLRKLLGVAENRPSQSFRIDATLVRDTLVLFRREHSLREFLPAKGGGASYGHGFEAAFTAQEEPRLQASASHHRAIKYDMGALSCVVQYEVDAWYQADEQADAPTAQSEGEKQDDGLLDGIVQGMDGLALDVAGRAGEPSVPATTPPSRQRARRPKGKGQSQGSTCLSVLNGDVEHQPSAQQLAEIKVRSKKPFQPSKAIPQMWFGRTPYLISGIHDQGVFSEINVENVGESFPEWESRSQESLKKLVAVITQLKEILIEQRQKMAGMSDGGSLASMIWAITCDHKVKPAQLLVYDLEKSSKAVAVPQEYVEAFWPEH
ncbi:hypothetical protein BFW01_g5143 [Lasiodiplodia theobromae]|nr:hypothetical protein BFW01_g5143 [Lasiodiplodia theobromae]